MTLRGIASVQPSHTDSWKRFAACEQMEKWRRKWNLDRIWFTDENVPLKRANSYDLVYANVSAKKGVTAKQLLRGRKHFSQSMMVSAAVSTFGNTSRFHTPVSKNKLHVIAKMSLKWLLRDIRFNDAIFRQDGVPTHRWRHVTRLLNLHSHDVRELIKLENSLPNSRDLNPVISCCGELCGKSCIGKKSEMLVVLSSFR